MEDITTIIYNLKTIFRLKDDKEVANLLGITISNFSKMKSRNKIPYEELFLLARKKKIDINSIFYGQNICHLKEIDYEKEIVTMISNLKEEKKEYYYHKIKADTLEKND